MPSSRASIALAKLVASFPPDDLSPPERTAPPALKDSRAGRGCHSPIPRPYVLPFNKRDLPNVAPVAEMVRLLRKKEEPVIDAVAPKGVGVFETLKAVAKLVLSELTKAS